MIQNNGMMKKKVHQARAGQAITQRGISRRCIRSGTSAEVSAGKVDALQGFPCLASHSSYGNSLKDSGSQYAQTSAPSGRLPLARRGIRLNSSRPPGRARTNSIVSPNITVAAIRAFRPIPHGGLLAGKQHILGTDSAEHMGIAGEPPSSPAGLEH